MPKVSRTLLGFATLSLPLLLAACPGEFGGGYDKVAFRERTPLALAAAPDPPPVIAGIGGAAAAETPTLAANLAPAGVTQEMVEEGQRLYGTVCTACHGAGAAGTPAGPGLRDQEWIHIRGSYDELVTIITTGVANPVQYPGMMPPLGGGNFNAEQVRSIAAYIFALSTQAPA
jgi:mono/diheme cytochrome c family protein